MQLVLRHIRAIQDLLVRVAQCISPVSSRSSCSRHAFTPAWCESLSHGGTRTARTKYERDREYSWPPCRADTARGTAVPCWHGTAPCRGVPPCRPCRAWPCHGPGLRPMTRHMGRFSVPCRPCATAILAVPCRPTAHQQKTLKINRKFQSLSSKLQMITCHRIIK